MVLNNIIKISKFQ